ncbi:CLUMA_CG006595, isoform A [Clunio marinus]|uniref:CLUMA_CG006595, isoform A n=1 Tax=Clunio marinus TaxID=568069 RepID=A0A1J1I3S5_9DIPT|nr:CLUMA_CG006595, isoform A [Clunio marinus]
MEYEERKSSINYNEICRCCFKSFTAKSKSVKIDKMIEKLFLEITQIELKTSKGLPDTMCITCINDLKYCSRMRRISIANQTTFYDSLEKNNMEVCTGTASSVDKYNTFTDDRLMQYDIENCDDFIKTHKIMKCPYCLQTFNDESKLKYLMETEFTISPFHSRNSKNSISSDKDFRRQKGTKPAEIALTEILTIKQKEEKHDPIIAIMEKELKLKNQCPRCGVFVKSLSEHQKIVHVQEKRFQCDFCNYSCYFKTKITRHLQRHIPKHLRDQLPCEFCTFIATRKDALKSHILTMHQKKREKDCLCIECGKSFFNKSQLNTHIKSVHEKIKNHLCNHCGKNFFNIKDMEMHIKRHGEKDLACDICEKLFYCSLDLRRHMRIHSEPKICCDIQGCSRKFYTTGKLKEHIRIRHEGARDFFCDYCSSRFSQNNNLKRHINSVHKSLRINCPIPGCNYSVARKDKYKNHLSSQHNLLDDKTKYKILKNIKFV